MINLYDSRETNFYHNGLVVLSDCQTAFVEEELNGKYELELVYPIDARGKWQSLIEGNLLKVDGQLFRIYHKEKTLGGIKANARHIFYDLLDNFVENCRIGNLNAAGALNTVLSTTQYSHGFMSMSDIETTNTYSVDKLNPVEAIMGDDGIISQYGGELVRDIYTIRLYQVRGMDRGVLVSYGKNVLGIEETLNMDSVCTRILPIGNDGLLLPEKYLDSPLINSYPHPIIKPVEFSDCETETALRIAGQSYLENYDKPLVNYAVDFIELTKTMEYKHYAILETVFIGDTVTIRHTKLNIDIKAKVIRIKKNLLTNRIEEVELGSFKKSLSDVITKPINDIRQQQVLDKTDLQTALDNATEQINNALGGFVLKQNGELLIMDTEEVLTATKVWRWNQGGLGYSGTGYNGPFRTAITADGHILADFIDTGVLNASLIKTGTMTSKTGLISISLDDEVLNIGGKIIYNGVTGELTLDLDVVISWENISGKPEFPPADADNTEGALLGNGFTKIGATYVYTGTLTAYQINAVNLDTLNISGVLNCGDTLEIGQPNATGGQCHINTALDGFRMQAHVPGNYVNFTDDGGVSFYVGDTTAAVIFPNGSTSLKPIPVTSTSIVYKSDGTGFDTDLDGSTDSWTWTKDGNGRITKLESERSRVVNITY